MRDSIVLLSQTSSFIGYSQFRKLLRAVVNPLLTRGVLSNMCHRAAIVLAKKPQGAPRLAVVFRVAVRALMVALYLAPNFPARAQEGVPSLEQLERQLNEKLEEQRERKKKEHSEVEAKADIQRTEVTPLWFSYETINVHNTLLSNCPSNKWTAGCAKFATLDEAIRFIFDALKAGRLSISEAENQRNVAVTALCGNLDSLDKFADSFIIQKCGELVR